MQYRFSSRGGGLVDSFKEIGVWNKKRGGAVTKDLRLVHKVFNNNPNINPGSYKRRLKKSAIWYSQPLQKRRSMPRVKIVTCVRVCVLRRSLKSREGTKQDRQMWISQTNALHEKKKKVDPWPVGSTIFFSRSQWLFLSNRSFYRPKRGRHRWWYLFILLCMETKGVNSLICHPLGWFFTPFLLSTPLLMNDAIPDLFVYSYRERCPPQWHWCCSFSGTCHQEPHPYRQEKTNGV